MMSLTWSIFLAFKIGNDSLIFSTSEVEVVVLDAWAYDLMFWELEELVLLFFLELLGFLVWKYFQITFISFLDFAGREGGGGALLIIIRTDLGESFLEFPFVEGMHGVNFEEIFDLRVLAFWSVYNASHLDA